MTFRRIKKFFKKIGCRIFGHKSFLFTGENYFRNGELIEDVVSGDSLVTRSYGKQNDNTWMYKVKKMK